MTPQIDIAHLQQWEGRRVITEERLDYFPAAGLAATLDRAEALAADAPLPPLWHWLYFRELVPQSMIDVDGHPRRGHFLPPIPLPRRMWAGGRLKFLRQMHLGESVRRETVVKAVSHKEGRQGPLVFLTLLHHIGNRGGLAIEEEQDIVYRGPTGSAAAPAPPSASQDASPAQWRGLFQPDPVTLFRYSALTFNAHRIHYDLPYARDLEGYPGLVVHGPLTATLLVESLMKETGHTPRRFDFRGVSPLFAGSPVALCGKQSEQSGTYDLWAEGGAGNVGMTATAHMDMA